VPRPPKHVVFSKAEVGERVRAARLQRGLTQVELAKALGVKQANVSAIERGERGLTIHQLAKLTKVLRVPTDLVLHGANGTGEKTPLQSVKLLRRFQRLQELPEPKQRAILKVLDALLDQA
jgi:transcriptional regulator with XRE-family HTH domain